MLKIKSKDMYNVQWILLIVIGVVGMVVQFRLQSVFKKYSKVRFPNGLTGREVAEKMLRENGINDVRVISTPGQLTDHFNPKDKTVNLSESVYNSCSVSAAAVACHECGHAVQHATSYSPLVLRSKLVPVVSFSSQFSTWAILGGILLMSWKPDLSFLFWIGIAMVAASALFSLVTLPVEYNASARALKWVETSERLYGVGLSMAKLAVGWVARTYLVAVLSAIVILIYYIGFA